MATSVHNKLSGSRFINLCVSNLFLHVFVSSLIPLIASFVAQKQASVEWLGWGALSFAVGMIMPGPIGAHLMERRSRKGVFLKALLVIGPIVVWFLNQVQNVYWIVPLLFVQGVAFGVAQTALGTTLVNDVLLSEYRNKGDLIFGWAGRLGVPLGFFFGSLLTGFLSLNQAYWWSLVPCALSFVLVAQTVVPIKAPVKVSLFTLDRFFLPQSLSLTFSMFAAPWVLGRMIGMLPDAFTYLSLAIGVLLAFLLQLLIRRRRSQRTLIAWGYFGLLIALLLFYLAPSPASMLITFAALLVGSGVGAVSSRHLMDWITTAQHCQRGTAQNTYMLSWRLAFSLGLLFSTLYGQNHIEVDAVLSLLSFLLYQFWIAHRVKNVSA